MQPYFFPYLGYFSLIKHTDRFILLDSVQFIRHGWIDRNRILKQGDGWLYIRPSIASHPHGATIAQLSIDNTQPWREKILSQIVVYKRAAPFYWKVRGMLESVFEEDHGSIVSLNAAALRAVCGYLGLPKTFEIFSTMDLNIDEPQAPDEWALNICTSLGDVREYWNPPGGSSFFDQSKYREAGIDLKFQQIRLQPYDQKRPAFEPGLSIIDVMMFNSPERIHEMLDDYGLS
jgi:hypothetical protein